MHIHTSYNVYNKHTLSRNYMDLRLGILREDLFFISSNICNPGKMLKIESMDAIKIK